MIGISDMQKFLLNFGLHENTRKLLDTNPPKGDHLACLDGMRFLSISWVMLGHILQAEIDSFPISNPYVFYQVCIITIRNIHNLHTYFGSLAKIHNLPVQFLSSFKVFHSLWMFPKVID